MESNFNKILADLPKITESEFKKYLPALVSTKADEPGRKAWLDICLDPRLSVNVIDDVSGEIIHRVPPVIYTSDHLTGRNIIGIIDVWSKYNEVSPLHGARYASENIPDDMVVGEPPEEDVELWVYILKRYGYAASDATENPSMGALQDDPNSW